MRQQRHREPSTSPIVTILVVAGPGIAIAAVAGRPAIAWAAATITIALANLASLLTPEVGIHVIDLDAMPQDLRDLTARTSFEQALAIAEAADGPDHDAMTCDHSNIMSRVVLPVPASDGPAGLQPDRGQ